MSKIDSRIEKAIRIIWLEKDFRRGREAFMLLEQAAAEKDADAYYFLARCHAGPSYTDAGFGFLEDDNKSGEYLDLSIRGGSALGMFGARRFGGYIPADGTYVHKPYYSDREIWNEVCRIAESGELFTKYLVANAYYYGDVKDFLGIDLKRMPQEMAVMQLREWAQIAMDMYEELVQNNVILGLANYVDIITSGDYGIPKNEKRAQELRQFGADRGNPSYMLAVGSDIAAAQPEKAEAYFKRALEHGYVPANFYLGDFYSINGYGPTNLPKAKEYLERCLELGEMPISCNNALGELYFYGGDGIIPDYRKAFQHLRFSCDNDEHRGYDMLGTCYLKGLGTNVDYEKARQEFTRRKPSALAAMGLGEIYAYGLGVPVDIKKAMEYWNLYPDYPPIIEHKKKFKRTLFGWKRL